MGWCDCAWATIVNIAILSVRTSSVVGYQERRVDTATAEAQPHDQQMEEEENVRNQDKAPGNGSRPGVWIGAERNRNPWLVELLLTHALLQAAENSDKGNKNNSVNGDEEMHLDQAS